MKQREIAHLFSQMADLLESRARSDRCRLLMMLALSTDTHSLDQLDQMAIGLGVARRAWLEPRHLLNAFTLATLQQWIARKRQRPRGWSPRG